VFPSWEEICFPDGRTPWDDDDTQTRIYADPKTGNYFAVPTMLPKTPAGAITLNVSDYMFGLEAEHIAAFLYVLNSNDPDVYMTYEVEDYELHHPMFSAFADKDGSTDVQITFGSPDETVHRVVIPSEQAAAVRAAIKEATCGE
jgi:hypothetical protein